MVQTDENTAQAQSEGGYSAGSEFMATESEAGSASSPIMVALAGGGFALIWYHYSDTNFSDGKAVARFFNADGTPASDEIVIVSGEPLRDLSATPLADGGFLLSRNIIDPSTGTGIIRAQGYDDAGDPVGPAISLPAGGRPVSVQLSSGGYAIGWLGTGDVIHVQRFTSTGAPSGPETIVGQSIDWDSFGLTATADGGFAVAWIQPDSAPGDFYQVKAQFFDSSGVASGPAIVDSGGTFTIESPTVVALADGSYVLGWAEFSGSGGDSLFRLKVLPIGPDGLADGPPVLLATYESESQFGPVPSIVAHPDGGFVAMWPNEEPAPFDRVTHRFKVQQFDSSGAPVGPELEAVDAADSADIAVLADGTIATTWNRPDSDMQGVFGRVFRPADGPQATDGDDTIYGDGGANWIDGLAGDDELYGLGGDDELLGRSGHDELRGGAGNDVLRGGGGNDFLDGGAGEDELRGGAGHDFYVVDNVGDSVIEQADAGWDEVRSVLASFSLAALPNVEGLSAGSDSPHDFRGNMADNWIGGGNGADVIRLQDGGDDAVEADGGNDVLYFGAAYTAADSADGGAGQDSIVLQGHYNVTLGSLVGIESLSLQSGANSSFGDTANNFYDYSIATVNGNVAAGQQLIVNASSLRAGEDFSFDGSAETDGKFLIYGGHGVDILKGGSLGDVFTFEGGRWGPNDRVDGRSGGDTVAIGGIGGLNRIEFGSGQLTNIETVSLNPQNPANPAQKPSYDIVFHAGAIAHSATLVVNGSSVLAGQVVNIDGRALLGGKLILLGGGGHDVIRGGNGADVIVGGGGQDTLSGGGGADTFRYDAVSDSKAGANDLISGFVSGTDKIDLSRIDANTHAAGNQAFSWIGSSAFAGAGAASAGQLRSFESGGYRWVEGDVDGNGAADFAIRFQLGTAPLAQGDFIL